MKKHRIIMLIAVAAAQFLLVTSLCQAQEQKLSLFPIEKYDQDISHWIKLNEVPLMSKEIQAQRFSEWKQHYIGQFSPWDIRYIHQSVTKPHVLQNDIDFVYVATPAFRAWVKSTDIAMVDQAFIKEWQAAATELVAIMDTQISLIDEENALFRNSGYIGMVFPGKKSASSWRILIPIRDKRGRARIHHARLPLNQANTMPLPTTSGEIVSVIKKLIHRPYGWGGQYFYNDCATELKNLFTPFGIWLPISSSEQVDPQQYSIKAVDLSKRDQETRLAFLQSKGHPFMTIINDGGHVLLYLGTYPNPDDPKHHPVALSYQNVWGLSPRNPSPDQDRRSVIGGAVLLPILPYYPEDRGVASDANYDVFIAAFLD